MSVDSYEYEVMRAELLGLPPPERRQEPEKRDGDVASEETEPAIDEQELDVEEEKIKNVSGGLDELNTILTVTQKKLNKFKVICGSLTNVFKIRIHKEGDNSSCCGSDYSRSLGSASEIEKEQEKPEQSEENSASTDPEKEQKIVESQRTVNLADKITTQTDRLDSMLMKAEQAEMSLAHQNKQIRSFLR